MGGPYGKALPLQGDKPFGKMLMWHGRAVWEGPTIANALNVTFIMGRMEYKVI